eukprot:5631412-Amphidinium_carterae.5
MEVVAKVLTSTKSAAEALKVPLPDPYKQCHAMAATTTVTMAEAMFMSVKTNNKTDDKAKRVSTQNCLNKLVSQGELFGANLKEQLHPAVYRNAMDLLLG